MAIRFACECGKSINIRKALAGKRIRCPGCQSVMTVPLAGAGQHEAPSVERRGSRTMLFAGLGTGVLLLTCCCLGGIVGGYFLFMGPAADKVLTGNFPIEDRSKWSWTDARTEVSAGLLASVRAPYKGYKISLKAKTLYVIDLLQNGSDSDPYLVLHDPQGKQVAANDDGGAGLNARIMYTPTRDGEHRILAATIKGLGEFTLKIQEVDKALSDIPIEEHGSWLADSATLEISEAFRFKSKALFKAYQVPLKVGGSYSIELMHKGGDSDPFLVLHDPDGRKVAADDNGGGGVNARIIYTPLKEGVHRILAASVKGAGLFTLTVREYKAPPKLPAPPQPKPPTPTDRGKMLTLPAVEMSQWSKQDPIHPFFVSPVKTYTVNLKAGKVYTIDLVTRQKGQDPFLILTDAYGQMLASDDDGGGYPNARIIFTPTVDGEYRILATTLDHGLGPFTLSVRESPK
jgi:hypothetical protein